MDDGDVEQGDTAGFTRLAGQRALRVAACDLLRSIEDSVLTVRERSGAETSYTVRDVRAEDDGLVKVLVLVPS